MTPLERRIRLCALLAMLGLLVELGSLLWKSPLSFVFFAAFGPLLIGAATLLYLVAIARNPPAGS